MLCGLQGSPVELFIEHGELLAVLGHQPHPKKTGQVRDANIELPPTLEFWPLKLTQVIGILQTLGESQAL
jgi:hypothetical protein